MDMAVFYEVIVPLMEVRGTATICISTPLGSWNFYSELTEIRDDKGRLLFNVIRVGMSCRRCKRAGKEDTCNHPSVNRPEWKSEDGFAKVKAIFGDRKTMLKREAMGLVADDESVAFQTDHLKAFFARKPFAEPHQIIDKVYVAVDPNGGGNSEDGSETAIVSFFYQAGHIVASLHARARPLRALLAAARHGQRVRGLVHAVRDGRFARKHANVDGAGHELVKKRRQVDVAPAAPLLAVGQIAVAALVCLVGEQVLLHGRLEEHAAKEQRQLRRSRNVAGSVQPVVGKGRLKRAAKLGRVKGRRRGQLFAVLDAQHFAQPEQKGQPGPLSVPRNEAVDNIVGAAKRRIRVVQALHFQHGPQHLHGLVSRHSAARTLPRNAAAAAAVHVCSQALALFADLRPR